ncbi:hypothetical protein ACWCWD_35935, partial [Streptomyces sp. NPDC001493]
MPDREHRRELQAFAHPCQEYGSEEQGGTRSGGEGQGSGLDEGAGQGRTVRVDTFTDAARSAYRSTTYSFDARGDQ